MTKIAGSGSNSQRHGSADPDAHQNVMDPEHCFVRSGSEKSNLLLMIGIFFTFYQRTVQILTCQSNTLRDIHKLDFLTLIKMVCNECVVPSQVCSKDKR